MGGWFRHCHYPLRPSSLYVSLVPGVALLSPHVKPPYFRRPRSRITKLRSKGTLDAGPHRESVDIADPAFGAIAAFGDG
jgi:hypothetical protein